MWFISTSTKANIGIAVVGFKIKTVLESNYTYFSLCKVIKNVQIVLLNLLYARPARSEEASAIIELSIHLRKIMIDK